MWITAILKVSTERVGSGKSMTEVSAFKPGFRNWVPKIDNCKILGCLIFHRRPKYNQVTLQGLSQDLETGRLKLAVVKFLGVQIIKEDHNILRFQS